MKNKMLMFAIAIIFIFTINNNNAIKVYASTPDTMKLYYIIDDNGYYIDQVFIVNPNFIDYSHYIEIEPVGLKIPKWDGTKWIETYVTPNPIPTPTIIQESDRPLDDLNNVVKSTVETTQLITLTANEITLSESTTYDININNKIVGSSYVWSSDDTSIAKVSKLGLVYPVSNGKTIITCKVTLPNDDVLLLTSDINVGIDDNSPTLTENDLELSIGDYFDINLENTISKSKYKWTTSDKSIVRVNSANGKIKTVSRGNAIITCTITKNKQITILKCEVSVTD